jgi:hypothetical protein
MAAADVEARMRLLSPGLDLGVLSDCDLVITGPHIQVQNALRWQVGETSNAHATREPAVDGRFDQIRREESKRDCHVDLSHAAVFPFRDAVPGSPT